MRRLTSSASIRGAAAAAAAAIAGFVATSPLLAQAPTPSAAPQRGFEGRIEVSEALLDVLVTDRDGHVILGLEPGDFLVREAGEPVEVTAANFYSNRRFLDSDRAEKLRVDPATVPDERLFVLLFHDQLASTGDVPGLLARQLRAGRDATAWVHELEPGDLVAVFSYGSRLVPQVDFTDDRAELTRAIDRASRNARPPKRWPSRQGPDSGAPSVLERLPAGDALRDASETAEAALGTLAGALSGIPGRKNLIVFTTGFGELDENGRFRPGDPRYRPMMQSLNAANVATYVLDLVDPAAEHSLEGAMSRLAFDTGGRAFFDRSEFRTSLATIARTTSGYYLVSIRSAHRAGTNGYAEVEVSARNPEFRVTARRGYRFGETD